MASLHRPPAPALRALVSAVWSQDAPPAPARTDPAREHVLPTGATHIALRIGGAPLLLFDDAADTRGHRLGHAVVGGARTGYHLRDVSQPAASVGAMLRPGAARVLLGVPEAALAGHHTPLDRLLHASEVDALLTRLRACVGAAARLAAFEHWLIGRARGLPPALHRALAGAWRPELHEARVAERVRASGLSHRHYIAQFRQATGLAPREWLALQRFGQALSLAASDASRGWAEIAVASGFADQAHLANTFRAVAGFTPSEWRRRADPGAPRHVAC